MTDAEIKRLLIGALRKLPRPVSEDAASNAAVAEVSGVLNGKQMQQFRNWLERHARHLARVANG